MGRPRILSPLAAWSPPDATGVVFPMPAGGTWDSGLVGVTGSAAVGVVLTWVRITLHSLTDPRSAKA